jgi:hypothetical protein
MVTGFPHAESAVLDIRKLEDYCLNPSHPRGRHKARVFLDEAGIAAALGSRALANVLDHPAAQQIALSTSSSGALRLFDSAERGDMLQSASEAVRLAPGDYCVRAGYLESCSLAIVVRRFSPI